jgi:hypothetical protein
MREQKRAIRTAVEEEFFKAVQLEGHSDRRPSLSEKSKARSTVGR